MRLKILCKIGLHNYTTEEKWSKVPIKNAFTKGSPFTYLNVVRYCKRCGKTEVAKWGVCGIEYFVTAKDMEWGLTDEELVKKI